MLFSVIIPVFNVEQYLRKCIDSVLAQTCDDYELILIDDGSADQSGQICDWYADQYQQCVVFHKKNGGLASARNMGLDQAHGRYIIFVDSDDFIEKELLMKVRYELEEHGFDTCSFSVRRVSEEGNYLYEMRYGRVTRCFDSDTSERIHFLLREYLQYHYGWEAWFYVYTRQIIEQKHLRFHEDIQYAEDLPFTFEYMLYAKRFIKLPDVLYNYTARKNSISAEVKWTEEVGCLLGHHYNLMAQTIVTVAPDHKKRIAVLLYGAMLLYFIPRYSQHHSLQEIGRLLRSNADVEELWKRVKAEQNAITKEFGIDNSNQISKWVSAFLL